MTNLFTKVLSNLAGSSSRQFQLLLHRPYRVIRAIGSLHPKDVVTYQGTTQEWYDKCLSFTWHLFDRDGKIQRVKDDGMPGIGDSHQWFADIPEISGHGQAIDTLINGLLDRDQVVRRDVLKMVLASTPHLDAIVPWIYYLAATQSHSACYLQKLKELGPAILPVVETCYAEKPWDVREGEKILSALGSSVMLSQLLQMLSSLNRYEVLRALNRLAELKNQAAIPNVEALQKHPHIEVRLAAERVLGILRRTT